MDRRAAFAQYFGLLVVNGAVIAARLFPQPVHLVVVVALIAVAVLVRMRVLHEPSYSKTDFIGAGVAVLSYLVTALVLRRWPFA